MKPEQLQRLVGNNIRYYRIQAGLTQEDLAKRAGINRSYISALERGTKNARLSTLAT
ncbi:MAG: helix-turn-helix transcriptional regulator, partial [Anaerolineaceae bacterium]|nr:helix-turn-helix transcriptional regulator [Anaerolineaceae bacterium]